MRTSSLTIQVPGYCQLCGALGGTEEPQGSELVQDHGGQCSMGSVALLCAPCHPGSVYHTQACFLLGDQVTLHNGSRFSHSQVRRVSLLWVPHILDSGLYFQCVLAPLCPESALTEGCCNSRVRKSLYFIAC